jgi:pseudouridine synthase
MLNKPSGFLCSVSDPHAEQTVFDLVKLHGVRLFSAGRLDLNSEGLLILTNDGDYSERLTHPRHGILKRYLVRTNKPISKDNLDMLRAGIRDFGEFLKPVSILRLKPKEYEFKLNEGKKREIRRLVAATGAKVTLLKRISIGDLQLGTLPTGHWRFISKKEIDASLVSNKFAKQRRTGKKRPPQSKSKAPLTSKEK